MDLNEADMTGRRLAHYMWSELEKIAQGATGGPEAGGAVAPSGELEGGLQRESEGTEEASPSHGIVASRVEQLDDKKARGTPVIQPPPGFVFAPELQAFVPDESNPGWMNAEQAAEAAKAKSFYDQGQQDATAQQAQQQLDTQVEADTQQAVAEQGQMQEQQMLQQQATQDATTKAVAKEQAQSVASNLKSPDSITGKPAEKKPAAKKKPQADGGKGVTIKIGK